MISNAERWRLVGEILFDLLELQISEDEDVRRQSLAEATSNLDRLLGITPEVDEDGKLFLRALCESVKESLD